MKCLVMGHLTRDVIIRGSKIEERIGGGAYYSALALSRFCSPVILTSVGRDFPEKWIEELEDHNIEVISIPSEETTAYELRYFDSNTRKLRLLSRAEDLEAFPEEKYEVVLLNPVAGEIPGALVERVKERFPFVSADVQGFIREPRKGEVRLREIDASFLRGINVLHSDRDEFSYLGMLNPADVEVLLISDGSNSGTAYYNGESYSYRPVKLEVPESTGAGDVFLASFVYFYRKCPFIQALKRANAFTALFLKYRHFEFSIREVNDLAAGILVERSPAVFPQTATY